MHATQTLLGGRRLLLYVAAAGILVATMFSLTDTTSAESDATIAQGFRVEEAVDRGVMVSIKPEDSRAVEVASRDHLERLIGVVTAQPLVEISADEAEAQVVTSGLAYTLVSDINGEVNRGDRVTVSTIDGIGAKAVASTQIVGIAHGNFDEAQLVKEHALTDTNGIKRTVKIGLMQVNIGPTYYVAPDTKSSLIPGFLQSFANSVAGETVSPTRIFISVIVFLAGLMSIGILFYSSVRFSITAIGRNPLSAKAVHRGLIEVAVIGAFVLLATLIAVYLILVI